MDVVKTSKRLSLVLRHRPESIGVTLDEAGWVPVDVLLAALAAHGLRLSRADLQHVVDTSDKKRFTLDASGDKIRAAQGHSVAVELGYPPAAPPPVLFHGTAERFVAAILREGLTPQRRHAVHLSPDRETAIRVGSRRGAYALLQVDSEAMARDGHVFARSENGVWLTARVPAQYLLQIQEP